VTVYEPETSTNGVAIKVYWDQGTAGIDTIWETDVADHTSTTLPSFEVTDTLVLAAEIGPIWSWDAVIYFEVVNLDDPSEDLGPDSGFWTYETGVNLKSQRTYDVERQVFLELRK